MKNENGSALLELIISMTILAAMMLSLLPALTFITQATVSTKIRTIGYNVAVKEAEKIKSLNYDDVGVAGGNPAGAVTADKDVRQEGVNFHIKTRIKWVDDSDDNLTPLDQDPRDYKKITVTASWTFGKIAKNASISTIISRESMEQISTGGNIKVIVKDNDQVPIDDAQVHITTGPSSPINDFTDEMGETFFALLDPSQTEGDYSISVEKNDYVVHPQMQNLTTTVTTNETRTLEFLIDKPGFLNVTLVDDETGETINEPSQLSLSFSGTTVELTGESGIFSTQRLFPGVWEVIGSSSSHDTSSPATVEITRDNTESTTIRLGKKKKGNMHLQVFDNVTRESVPYNNIAIKRVDTTEIINAQTNVEGILEIQLLQVSYDVEVSKSGYQTKVTRVDITHPGNTFVDVFLDQAVVKGSLLVKTLNQNRTFKPDVLIRVIGPSYDRQGRTDSNGELLFNNLNAGRYTVYRWSWGWRYANRVNVITGQQSTVSYRF